MTLSAATLASELKAMPAFATEVAAAEAWAEAFTNYFQGVNPPTDSAESTGVPIAPAVMPAAKAAMVGALSGMKSQGATSIQNGIAAFWASLAALPAAAWVGVTLITPPPGLTGMLEAALIATFASNKSGLLEKDEAIDALAAVIHTNNLGGTATWTGWVPPAQPII